MQTQQGEQIRKAKSAAIFVGENAIQNWQLLQVEALIHQFVVRNIPVLPVILPITPSEPELTVFLETIVGVDFRRAAPDPLDRLIEGITWERECL